MLKDGKDDDCRGICPLTISDKLALVCTITQEIHRFIVFNINLSQQRVKLLAFYKTQIHHISCKISVSYSLVLQLDKYS